MPELIALPLVVRIFALLLLCALDASIWLALYLWINE